MSEPTEQMIDDAIAEWFALREQKDGHSPSFVVRMTGALRAALACTDENGERLWVAREELEQIGKAESEQKMNGLRWNFTGSLAPLQPKQVPVYRIREQS